MLGYNQYTGRQSKVYNFLKVVETMVIADEKLHNDGGRGTVTGLSWMVLRDQQRSSGRSVEGLCKVLRYGDTQETETGDKDY